MTLVVLVVLAMLGIMLVAGVVVLYVAYPHRGEEVPGTPWVGTALRRGVDALPTLADSEPEEESALLDVADQERV